MSNARKVFAVNEGDIIRRSKKDTSSNNAPAALGSFFPLTSKLTSLVICPDHIRTLLVPDCFYITWHHPDVTNFRDH